MKVLVTGATGFTGQHLVRRLASDGHEMRVIARDESRATNIGAGPLDVVTGDIADPAAVARAVAGRDVVFHLAAAYREAALPAARYHAVHVEATRLLLEASLAAGVSRFVHCSTVGVHGHIADPPADERTPHCPGDIYQATKSEGERLALDFHRRTGFPLTVARPTAIYGPGDLRLLKLFSLIARRRFVMIGNGQIYYHMVHVADLIEGFLLLARQPQAIGEVFILGGAEYRTLEQIVETIARIVRVPVPRLRVPAAPVQWAGSLCERLCLPLGLTPPIYRRRVDFFTKSRAFSIEKARRMLRYAPAIDLETGLAETARWYRQHGLLPSRPSPGGS